MLRSIRLVRKFAASLNGFDLSQINIGDVLELPEPTATMLIAEGWAEPLRGIPKDHIPERSESSRSSVSGKQKLSRHRR